MSIRYHSAVIFTEDIEKMKAFYTSVMGQAIEHDLGGCVMFACGLTIWRLEDEYPLSKALGGKHRAGANGSMEICFETEEFEGEAVMIKESGVKLIHDEQEENWGQMTIRFYDPEGNIIELGESMSAFVKRLFRLGMSMAEVSKKTGLTIKLVKEYLC